MSTKKGETARKVWDLILISLVGLSLIEIYVENDEWIEIYSIISSLFVRLELFIF